MKRKLLGVFTAIMSLLCFALCFAGCATVSAAKMDRLVGTYQLTQYDRAYEDDRGYVDMIDKWNVAAYLVIDGTENAYLVYKDCYSPLTCRTVAMTYSYKKDKNDNPTDKISYVEYQTADGGTADISQRGYFGFDSKNRNLNYHHPGGYTMGSDWIIRKTWTAYLKMDKVSNAKDLSFVERELGVTLEIYDETVPSPSAASAVELEELKGTYQLTRYDWHYTDERGKVDMLDEKNITAYFVIDGGNYAYLVYRDDEHPLVCRQVSFSYDYAKDEDGYSTFKVGYIEYHAESDGDLEIYDYAYLIVENTNLYYSHPEYVEVDWQMKKSHSVYLCMGKVSNVTDLSFAEQELGVKLTVGEPEQPDE